MMQPQQGKQAAAAGVAAAATPNRSNSGSSLDHLETNRQEQPPELQVVNSEMLAAPVGFRHSGWQPTRDRIRLALAATGAGRNRLERWDDCGGHPWLARSETDPELYRVQADHCHDRFCQPCASSRSRTIAANLAEKMARRKHRLITLTLRSATEPLLDLLDLLYKSFAKLRRTRLWKQRIRGGAAFLEVKFNAALERWHPHLHIIAEGQYIQQQELSKLWLAITRTSYIIDVRLIRNTDEAIGYVAKYASKPLSKSFARDHRRLCEAMVALAGRRLCLTFGTWRRWKLLHNPDSGPWTYIASLREIVREATAGSTYHLELLQHVGLTVPFVVFRPDVKPRPPPAERYLFDVPAF